MNRRRGGGGGWGEGREEEEKRRERRETDGEREREIYRWKRLVGNGFLASLVCGRDHYLVGFFFVWCVST